MDQAVSSKKTVILTILAILLCTMIGIGFSYAVWNQTEKQNTPNLLQSGCFEIELTDEKNVINLQNQFPITDVDGKKLSPYTFTVKNTCSIYASYSVNLEKLSGSDLDDQYIKVMLNNKRPQLYNYYSVASKEYDDSVESRTLTTDGLEANESKTYTLRIWLDESGTSETVGNKEFASKIVIKSVATYQSGAEYIASLLDDNQGTMTNDDPDENVRYIGATPNNHVTFNGEDWQIIGVFDTFECNDDATTSDYTGKCSTKKLLKIIRNESIGSYSWDSSEESINGGWGVNEWSQADLKTLLNNYYYNGEENQTCYNSYNDGHITCSFNTTGIKEETRDMIANVLWYTGTVDGDWSQSSTYTDATKAKAKVFYEGERSDKTGKICNQDGSHCSDSESRSTKWIGKVGLMYPSDYGYSIGNDHRETCLATSLYSYSSCASSSWLFMSNTYQWTIAPVPYGSDAGHAFFVYSSGGVNIGNVYGVCAVRPVVYLKSGVKIIADAKHNGSEDYPYELSL